MTTIPSKDEYEAAAASLLDAVSLGGGSRAGCAGCWSR